LFRTQLVTSITANSANWFGMVSDSNFASVKDTGPMLVDDKPGAITSDMADKPEVSVTDTSQMPYIRDPDVQLMLRTREGDDEAFTELVNSYQDRLIGIFYHMLRDQSSAEDLAQEVFLRIYRARLTYKPTAKFSTWLFRIASNLASNQRRSRGRSREVSFNVRDSGPMGARPAENLVPEKSGMMPTRQLAKSEMQAVVREAMETLNERQKMAVLLNKFEGMSYADIGEAMELNPAAVKSLLSRAREKLREKLQRFVDQPG
jgi:RNA polymerase sigma-70 factor (ECF subfamily)